MAIAEALAAIRRRVEAIEAGPDGGGEAFAATVAAASAAAPSARPRDERAAAANGSSRPDIDRLVRSAAAASRVDPALVDAVIVNESAFDPNATSPAGARGLMQLMPETAAALGCTDAYDPQQNVRGGTRYLRALLDRFGDVELALAAYNAGPAAVAHYGGVPPYAETKMYVRRVMSSYRELRARSQVGNLSMTAGSHPAAIIVP